MAWSGGGDSTAAAWLVRQAGFPVVLLHVDHGLRPEDRDAEQAWLLHHGRALGTVRLLPVTVDPARGATVGEEAAAREARHGALAAACRAMGAAGYVLGHTEDDQAETVLLRILRGTGIAGLGAMAPYGPSPADPSLSVIRPLLLLGLGRGAARALCQDAGLSWWEDPSNASPRYLRNVVRTTLLPLMTDLNPAAVRHLVALAADARAVTAEARTWEEALADACAVPGGVSLPPLGDSTGRVLHAALRRLGIEAGRGLVGRLASLPPGQPLPLPGGGEAWRSRDRLELRAASAPPPRVDLDPGAPSAWGNWWFLPAPAGSPPPDAAPVLGGGRTAVRAWQPGDRLGPRGVLVKDLMDRAGIDRWSRRRWPVVLADGEPWWVPGLGLGQDGGMEQWVRQGSPWLRAVRNAETAPNV